MNDNYSLTNADFDLHSAIAASNVDDILEGIATAAGRYQKSVTFVTPMQIDPNRLLELFEQQYMYFYSNLTHINLETTCFPRKVAIKVDLTYRIGRFTLSRWENETDAEVERLKKMLFVKGMTPLEKAYVAHNYLAKTVDYWDKPKTNPVETSRRQSAYGALINKECVCQGYAEAYKRLLDGEQGIQCHIVTGVVVDKQINHAWNVVTCGGNEFFHVDVTWDAQYTGRVSDEHFGLSDSQLVGKRTWNCPEKWRCSGQHDVLSIVKRQISRNRTELINNGLNPKWLEV